MTENRLSGVVGFGILSDETILPLTQLRVLRLLAGLLQMYTGRDWDALEVVFPDSPTPPPNTVTTPSVVSHQACF